jgi:hypothetical protein
MTKKKKAILAASVVVMVALGALVFIKPPATTDEPLPNPNGYDDFLKGAALASQQSGDWNTLSIEELRQLEATNQAALEAIRVGLTKDCRVVPYSMVGGTTTHMNDLANLKAAAQALCAANRLALLESRTNDAALLAVDCIRFGQESTRGGVLIDGLVGIAIQALGRARLEEALPGTDAATARNIGAALEGIITRQESSATIWEREAQWARAGRFGTGNFFAQFLQSFLQRDMKAKSEQKFLKSSADLHRITLRAAARAYELDHGQPPASARDLVPQYLKAVPVDPATGQELPLN